MWEGGPKNGRVKLNHLHMHQGSPLLPIFRAASTVIPLLPKAIFTPSIQPNLGLPRTSPPLTSIRDTTTKLRKISSQKHSLSFSHPMPLFRTTPLVQLLLHTG